MHSAVCAPNDDPPSDELVSAMKGDGQWLEQPGGGTP
jgi:hypothetical protein